MKRPQRYRAPHERSREQRAREYDDRRGSASERGYDWRWHKASRAYLAEHPLCVMCEARGETSAATVVDHVIPHKGDALLFWDRTNWQGLCVTDHSRVKQIEERNSTPRKG